MRRLLILGCFLLATVATGCSDALLIADLKCGKDGKLRGDLELVIFGNEESQAEIDDASCEDIKEAKRELKHIKLAIGYEDGDEFVPVVFSKKYEIEDENCDGYTDISWEFRLRKLVRCGLLDEYTEELLVGIYFKDDCEWVLEEYGAVAVRINYDCDDDDDCDDDGWKKKKSYDCDDSSNGDGYDCDKEKSYDCDKDGWTKDCDNSSNGDSYDCDKEEKSYDCDDGENGSSNGDGDCDYKKKKKDCDNDDNDNQPA